MLENDGKIICSALMTVMKELSDYLFFGSKKLLLSK